MCLPARGGLHVSSSNVRGGALPGAARDGTRRRATAAPLTIDEAVAEAIDHNLSVIAERYNLAVADARVLTASLRPNPVVTASAMLPDATIFDANVNPREGIVRGDVLLERGGKRERRIEVAQRGAQRRRACSCRTPSAR